MSEKNTLGIFEAGISQPDEMERLQPIIAPTIGIITNIGEAHQENFLSSNQKCMEKLTLSMIAKPLFMMGMIYLSPIVSNRLAFPIKAIAWSRTDSEAPLFIESIDKKEFETIIHCTLLGFQPGRYHSVHGRRFYRERDPLYGGYALPKTHQRKRRNEILAS